VADVARTICQALSWAAARLAAAPPSSASTARGYQPAAAGWSGATTPSPVSRTVPEVVQSLAATRRWRPWCTTRRQGCIPSSHSDYFPPHPWRARALALPPASEAPGPLLPRLAAQIISWSSGSGDHFDASQSAERPGKLCCAKCQPTSAFGDLPPVPRGVPVAPSASFTNRQPTARASALQCRLSHRGLKHFGNFRDQQASSYTIRLSWPRMSREVARSKNPARDTGAVYGASKGSRESFAGGGEGAFVAAPPLCAKSRAFSC